MKLRKVGTTALAIALLIGGGVSNATYAMELQNKELARNDYQIIRPMWDNISGISPYMSAEGTTLYPEVYIKAKSSSGSISGTMYLERYISGRWTSVVMWNFSGTSSVFLSKIIGGTSGNEYRTRVVVTVDGETAEAISGSLKIY